jgi:hypothetical protein
MRTTTRAAGFVAVIAVITALLSPAVSAQAALPYITGTTNDTGWRDTTLVTNAKVGVFYSDTVQGPPSGGPYSLGDEYLPAGLSASIDPDTEIITISGTPTTADSYTFDLFISASNGENFYGITFTGFPVAPATIATTTTVTTAEFSHYSSVNLQASVSSNTSGGTVDFYLDDTLVGNDIAVSGVGTASYTWAVPQSFVGSSPVVTAVFSGSSTHATSTSTSDPSVYIYGDRVVTGAFLSNGIGLEGRTIRLLNASNLGFSGLSDTTNASGEYSIAVPAPTSLADARRGFVVEDFGAQLYYSASAAWKQPNVQNVFDSTHVYEADWQSPLNLLFSTGPAWSDETLAQPREGESYSDSVTAITFGAVSTITYSLSGDPLPSWLTFSNGAFIATDPTDQLAHTFTVQADSIYGAISKQFTLQAGAAAMPPTFTDTTIVDLQVGTPLTDAIAATGDATITYSSTALPPGLLLDPVTGALTGTPTEAGDFVVTFTATNDEGFDTYVWEPTVTVAPDLELTLNFAAGTTIETATTDIGAGGLQVGSTYTLTMFSTPRILHTGTIDASGAFLHTITLPADTPVGAHELVLTGVAPDGSVLTARAWFTLLSNGRIGAVSYSGPIAFSLAATGSEPIVPLGIAGGLLLAGFLALRSKRGKFAAQ